MRNFTIRATLVATLAMLACPVASAQGESAASAKKHWLNKAEVEARVAGAGYKVKRTRNGVGRYEVRAIRKDGKTIWVYVNPWTGEVSEQ
jgi:hypothetical protein